LKTLLTILCLIIGLQMSLPAQGTLYEVEVNGPRATRINIVFLSDGYTTATLPTFAGHVQAATELLFSKEPWKQYRSYCNVYRIEIPSNQNGTDYGSDNTVKDTYFHSGFNPSVPQLCAVTTEGLNRAYARLNQHIPEYDVPVILVNDTKYGGAGGPISVATVHASSGLIVEHEIGHSLVDLADEYDVHYPGYTPLEKPNNTAQTNRAQIKWNHWIDPVTPVPTPEVAAYLPDVGLYEGSMYRTSGWYRPHLTSVMKTLDRPCGQVNREAFVLKFYDLISPVEAASPAPALRTVLGTEQLSFNITPKVPSDGPPLVAVWSIDGVEQQDATGMQFQTMSDTLGNGLHNVSVTIKDPTPFVRKDTQKRLQQTLTWSFLLVNQLPNTLAAWRLTYGTDLLATTQDGVANLMKYALGVPADESAPPSKMPAPSRTIIGDQEYLTLTIDRRSRRADIDYIVETCGDLSSWAGGQGNTVTLIDTNTTLVVRDAVPISSSSQRFIRLKVSPK